MHTLLSVSLDLDANFINSMGDSDSFVDERKLPTQGLLSFEFFLSKGGHLTKPTF